MRVFFRKIKSGFIRLGKGFAALKFQIKKVCAVVKCLCLSLFSRESRTYIYKAEEKLNALFPDKGYIIDNAIFKNSASIDLSIIIATCNAERYIEECLNSVVNQKTKYNVEIIIVNDGSTDKTAEKIKPYLSDKRVKYYEQNNQGQSAARNFAIFNSVGKYLMIVDSDDIIADGSIDFFIGTAINIGSDIVEGKGQMFYNNIEFTIDKRYRIVKSYSRELLKSVGYSWGKIYKRELWENVSYPVGYIFEDIITKFILRRKANKIATSNAVIYGYRVGIQSSSHKSNNLNFLSSLRVMPKIWGLCDRNNIPKDKIFYLLSLNHIGLLNYIMLKCQPQELQELAFSVMQNQIKDISAYKPNNIPLMFKMLEKSIRYGKFKTWQHISETIIKYKFLKKYREIN